MPLDTILGIAGGATSAALAAREAAKNRRFQKKMYRHRFQYSVKDMKKAGINPILAASSGLGGGGSPSGSMASMPDLGSAATSGLRTGSERKKRGLEGDLLRKQMGLLEAQILNERARVGETRSKTQHNLAMTLLAVNAKNRWQPFADAGEAFSGSISGPAKSVIRGDNANPSAMRMLDDTLRSLRHKLGGGSAKGYFRSTTKRKN